MSNKSLLLAILVAWLFGSAWWQYNVIMKCNTTETVVINTDSIKVADSLAAIKTIVADSVASDSIILGSPEPGTTEEDLAKSEKYTTVFKPMNLYFNSNQANYIKTDDNKKFIDEAKAYLADHKDKTLSLTGHSDSDGSDELNLQLSEKRASDVKKKLTSIGFNADQILVEAKGETQPIASNDSPEGKKANRRVALVINQ